MTGLLPPPLHEGEPGRRPTSYDSSMHKYRCLDRLVPRSSDRRPDRRMPPSTIAPCIPYVIPKCNPSLPSDPEPRRPPSPPPKPLRPAEPRPHATKVQTSSV